jgi:dTDP-4-dehydrorhamnose 3,5-epimerase
MIVDVSPLELEGVMLIRSKRFHDERGYFAETYVQRDYFGAGIRNAFVQDNQSRSFAAGTVRGLHFQTAPFAQAKLVQVIRGRIYDVVVDLRRSSPTFGKHVGVELSAVNGEQLFVPVGFAHGFCTIDPDTEVSYKVDAVYSAAHDAGINWADPRLRIEWPVEAGRAIVSDKDRNLPRIDELPPVFH